MRFNLIFLWDIVGSQGRCCTYVGVRSHRAPGAWIAAIEESTRFKKI